MNTSESLSFEDHVECVAIHVIVLSLINGGESPYPLWVCPGNLKSLLPILVA